MSNNNRMYGVCKWFNTQKGYGFIRMDNGREVFVHHTGINAEGFRALQEGDEVSFLTEESKDKPGKYQAVDVRKV